MPDSSREFDVVIVGAGSGGNRGGMLCRRIGPSIDRGRRGLGARRTDLASQRARTARRRCGALDRPARGQSRGRATLDKRVRRSTQSAGGFLVSGEHEGRAFEVTGRAVILATGARERFLPFPGWTLPNVVGIGGAQALLKAGTSFAGKRVVIAGSGPLLLPVAASLSKSGAKVALVAEQAAANSVRRFALGLVATPGDTDASRVAPKRVLRLRGTRRARGSRRRAVTHRSVKSRSPMVQRNRVIACDYLCVAFGLVPNAELARLLGCEVEHGQVSVDATQATTVADVYCAGEPTGIGGVDLSIVEGQIAGLAAAEQTVAVGLVSRAAASPSRGVGQWTRRSRCVRNFERSPQPDTIVCRCEDVRLRELNPRWTVATGKALHARGNGSMSGSRLRRGVRVSHGLVGRLGSSARATRAAWLIHFRDRGVPIVDRKRSEVMARAAKAKSTTYERIYATVRKIPRGRVTTYGNVARLSGLAGQARLVGYALERAARRHSAAMASRHQRARPTQPRARRVERRADAARSSRARRCEGRRGRTRVARAIRLASPEDDAGTIARYLNTPKWPSSHHSRMKMRTVLKQPPPIFFAPYPAARPRSSLLIVCAEGVVA